MEWTHRTLPLTAVVLPCCKRLEAPVTGLVHPGWTGELFLVWVAVVVGAGMGLSFRSFSMARLMVRVLQ